MGEGWRLVRTVERVVDVAGVTVSQIFHGGIWLIGVRRLNGTQKGRPQLSKRVVFMRSDKADPGLPHVQYGLGIYILHTFEWWLPCDLSVQVGIRRPPGWRASGRAQLKRLPFSAPDEVETYFIDPLYQVETAEGTEPARDATNPGCGRATGERYRDRG